MKRRSGRLRLSAQDGYTAIEMIITMALTAIVSGAIFSSFLVLDRVQTAWEERDQARAVGVVAEEPLLRDVQAYEVIGVGTSSTTNPSPALTLSGIHLPDTNSTFQVDYRVMMVYPPGIPGGEPVLERVMSTGGAPRIVAHGVDQMSVCIVNGTGILNVTMLLDSIGSRKRQVEQVRVSPVLELMPRNPAPTLSGSGVFC